MWSMVDAPFADAVAESSRRLRARDRAHQTVIVSDRFRRSAFAQMRIINHPGNPVLEAVASRSNRALGISEQRQAHRPLLAGVHARASRR